MKVVIFRQDTRNEENRPLLLKEILVGRLRQGWGWDDSFDISTGEKNVVQAVQSHPYSPGEISSRKDAADIFNKLAGMLAIQPGTLILVPHQPEPGQCIAIKSISTIGSDSCYRFIAPLPVGHRNGDFRHCVDVDGTTVKIFKRSMAVKNQKVERALWGRGGYASPVNFVKDTPVAQALIDFVGAKPLETPQPAQQPNDDPTFSSWREGARRAFYGTRFERDPRLRREAVRIHGLNCQACSFNFADSYGQHGDGFIHVHHLKPLAAGTGEREVDPQKDLCVLCVNCHAMVHRRRNQTLSISALKKVLLRRTRGQKR